MNRALTISFLSHAVLLVLIITVTFSHSNLMKNIYVVNLISMPPPTKQIVSIEQTVSSMTKPKKIYPPTIIKNRSVYKPVYPKQIPKTQRTFSSEDYMQSLEKKLEKIGKSFRIKSKPSSITNNYSQKIKSVSPSKKAFTTMPLGQKIPTGYFIQIKNIIQRHWHIPQGFYSNPAIISFRLWNNGTYSNVILETGSGNQVFDNNAMQAIQSVNEFPRFPENLNARYVDITIKFTEGGIE